MSSDQALMDGAQSATPAAPRRRFRLLWVAVAAVIVLDVMAFLLFPPFPPGGQAGDPCAFPVCYINGNLEFPAPHTVWVPSGAPPATGLITFQVSVSSTLLTLWIVGAVLALALIVAGRRRAEVPGHAQNLAEWAYEKLSTFGVSLGGPAAVPYLPIFIAFFLLVLFSNWVGLIPPVGKVETLRAPTSDVNVTVGFALVSFCIFVGEGFRRLGLRGYLSKFFPLYEFKNGFSAGLIAMFVGIVELLLEFIKPLTLSMRLFGNIYGGEVALGVVTALFVAFLPALLLGLEFMLNFIQALIFSVLTLMFILSAIESHHHEEGEMGEEAIDALENHPRPHPAPAH